MENIKKCTKCGKELPLDRFSERRYKSGNTGYKSQCKDCINTTSAEWQRNNPEKRRMKNARWRENNSQKARESCAKWRKNNPEYDREWRQNNTEKNKERCSRWRKNNPGHHSDYVRERRIADLEFRLIKNIRSAMYCAFRCNTKAGHTVELLGCSIEYLRNYLERQFELGMTWDNYGVHGWQIDHIIPLSYFNFSDPDQQKRACHYTNLRPMWAVDNIRKSNKLIEVQLVLL